jgi:hypothetical protein
MTQGINNCGYTEGSWHMRSSFQGDTARDANIGSDGHCTENFPDGQNTVSWGTLPTGIFAITCRGTIGGNQISEADTKYNPSSGIVDNLPSGCTNSTDLQSVATHEWGHAFGLSHETSGSHEVMWPTQGPCRLRRHLGKGDYNGMAAMYGP